MDVPRMLIVFEGWVDKKEAEERTKEIVDWATGNGPPVLVVRDLKIFHMPQADSDK